MTPMTSGPVTHARGLLLAVVGLGDHLDPMLSLEVAQALNEITPTTELPTHPTGALCSGHPTESLRQARRFLRAAIVDETDLVALQQMTSAIHCVDAALTMVTP
jgi:hypothetical protein